MPAELLLTAIESFGKGVEDYTMNSRKLAATALTRYGIRSFRIARVFAKGQQGLTFKILANGKPFILKIFKFKARRDVEYELEFARWLRAHGARVQKVFPASNGEKLVVAGGKPACLLEFVEGRDAGGASGSRLRSPEQIRGVGAALARMHLASRGFKPRQKRDWGDLPAVRRNFRRYAREILRKPGKLGLRNARRLLAEIKRGLRAVRLPFSLPRGVVHADVKPENVLFAGNGNAFAAVIDFDYCFEAPFVFDLAKAAAWWCFDGDELDERKLRALLEGYESVRKLSVAEKKSFGDALRFALLQHFFEDLHRYALGITKWGYLSSEVFGLYRRYEALAKTKK